MSNKAGTELVERFLTDEHLQRELANWFDVFAAICAASAGARGFHEDEERILNLLSPDDRSWLESQLLQAEIGRIMSEGGEMVEGVRKPAPDSHCPDFPNWIIEGADIAIRLGDTMGKRGVSLGKAVVAKLIFNTTRPYKHGKNS